MQVVGLDSVVALLVAVGVLVIFGSMLALAEASISRMTPVRAGALAEQGARNARLLEQIEKEPARYLNSVYLSVMFAQNGSAILVAILAEHYFAEIGITLASLVFTLLYFVVVEAMSKTFAIQHTDRVALMLTPFVWLLGRFLSLPTRALIGLANILLPGKGLAQGPFVTEHEIRSLAEIGHQEGDIEAHEKEMIDSVFRFGDSIVREIMVPRPDVVAVEISSPLAAAADIIVKHGVSRLPVYRNDLDHTEGVIHAKDVLRLLHQGKTNDPLTSIMHEAHFVPESKRLAALLNEMRAEHFMIAIVSDEYGSVSGIVSLEDLLEVLVGNISDEYDRDGQDITKLGDGRYRVNAALPIVELNDALGVELPRDRWNTVGGLVFGVVGEIPAEGTAVELEGFRFTVEKVQGRRILTVIVARVAAELETTEEHR
jgi:CBS domain containing-hemolysin-like protein